VVCDQKATVLGMSLRFTDVDGSELPASKKRSLGAHVLLNVDDDDGDGIPDREDTDGIGTGDDDLGRVDFLASSAFANLKAGSVVIQRTSGALRLWKQPTMLPGDATAWTNNTIEYDLADDDERSEFVTFVMNSALYVEGFNASGPEEHEELKVAYRDARGREIFSDHLRVTVLGVERLPLGIHSDPRRQDMAYRVYVPTARGGLLTLDRDGNEGELMAFKPDGSRFENDTETGDGKHGWYTFRVIQVTRLHRVLASFVQEGHLKNMDGSPRQVWSTWWWPTDEQAPGPHMWEVASSYDAGKPGVLKKYDAVAPASTAWAWENTSPLAKCDHGADCTGGHCDAAAHVGLYMAGAKPQGAKTVGGVEFVEKDRLGIAVQRYWIGFGPDTETGTQWQYFKKSGEALTARPDWFHAKLDDRLRRFVLREGVDDPGGLVVRIDNFNRAVYKYRAYFLQDWTDEPRKVTISTHLTYRFTDWDYEEEEVATRYGFEYDADGQIIADKDRMSWGALDRPDVVLLSKKSAPLFNPQVQATRAKADLIIAP
jgi:hypothetical protein